MTNSILLFIFGFSFLFSYPESTTVIVSNLLEEQSITSVYLLLPSTEELLNISMNNPIQPGETEQLRFPWGYINRVILNTDWGNVYYQSAFAASSHPDSLIITRAKKEFGGIFDRIYGTLPIVIRNNTGVNIASVQVSGESVPEGNILGNNPLMPGEFIRIWVNSTEPYTFLFQDTEGYLSEETTVITSPDTVYSVYNWMFYHNGSVLATHNSGYSFSIANCIPSEKLVSVEAFDENGYSLIYFDFTEHPLSTWDRVATQIDTPPSFVSAIDSYGREYTLERPDSITNCYDFDLLSLIFNFSFPER